MSNSVQNMLILCVCYVFDSPKKTCDECKRLSTKHWVNNYMQEYNALTLILCFIYIHSFLKGVSWVQEAWCDFSQCTWNLEGSRTSPLNGYFLNRLSCIRIQLVGESHYRPTFNSRCWITICHPQSVQFQHTHCIYCCGASIGIYSNSTYCCLFTVNLI